MGILPVMRVLTHIGGTPTPLSPPRPAALHQQCHGYNHLVRRRLFNFAAAVSLALLLAVAVLWARGRSTWAWESVEWNTTAAAGGHQANYRAGIIPVGVTFSRVRVEQTPFRPGFHVHQYRLRAAAMDDAPFYSVIGTRGVAGIRWVAFSAGEEAVHEVLIPHWVLALLSAVLPAAWAVGRWRRRRTIAAGRCATCGYDLRATPEKCPECGAVPAVAGRQ